MEQWDGKKVLVLGSARQGQALVRYMVKSGASVTLSDMKPMDKLTEAATALKGLPIRWVVGGHPLSLLDEIDAVCVTGGADLRIPILKQAATSGIPILNDTKIFLDICKAPVIGITGSSGKTTTTTLVGRMAEAEAGKARKVWVGGNIGLPLLNFADQISENDIVILELSSFQLELFTKSPHIAAILNITPNHLDRHGTMENYTAAKAHIMDFQNASDTVVLFREDAICCELKKKAQGVVFSFGFDEPEMMFGKVDVFLDGDVIRMRKQLPDSVETVEIMRTDLIHLRGRHNVCNVMAACAIADAAGFSFESMRKGIEGFKGVEHRLQWVRDYKGASWYNDSIATAPERTLAAVSSFTEPLVMLLGGRDKKLPWDELAQELQTRARCIVLFGEAAPMIEKALVNYQTADGPKVIRCEELYDAVKVAAENCREGDVVLLSPGGTSYDAFTDFEERGRLFTKWVLALE